MSGSFIQSHWPCMTLWPISMFSRIFASDSAGGAEQPRRLVARGHQQRPATSSSEPAVQLDHAADVAARRARRGRRRPRRGSRRTPRRAARAAPASGGAAGCSVVSSLGRLRVSASGRSHSSISTWPSGALMQVRIISPARRAARPVRRSRTCPRRAARRRCGRCPSGSRTAARRRPPRRRPGSDVPPSQSASTSVTRKRTVPPCRRSASPPPMIGWKRSMSQQLGIAARLPVLLDRVEHLAGPERKRRRARASRGTSSASRVRRRAGRRSVEWMLVEPVARRGARPSRAAGRRR